MSKRTDGATIMVVDDTPANLKLLQEMLQENGYRVLAFPNGRLALNAAQKNPPDLFMLDITMPDMNGFDLCERIKGNESLKEIPVLFISALTETSDKVKAFASGGVDYVTKPFQFEEVRARVEAHLEIHRQKCELLSAYDKLRELEGLKDNLVHMIVHDLRSPLSAVLSSLDMAETSDLPEEAAILIRQALNSTKTLMEMISSVLDVSKMEAGQMVLKFTPADIRSMAEENIQMMEPLIGDRAISLTSGDDLPIISCDTHLIGRVFQNLIGNALKFTDRKYGTLSIGIERTTEGGVRVEIADNGPGIPPQYLEKIFDKFCQVERRMAGQIYSTGLGLTFCKLAVETHGGRIGVRSELEKGSMFWFELPAKINPPGHSTASAPR